MTMQERRLVRELMQIAYRCLELETIGFNAQFTENVLEKARKMMRPSLDVNG